MTPTVIYPRLPGKSDISAAAMRAALEAGLTVAQQVSAGLEVRRKVKHLTVIELRRK